MPFDKESLTDSRWHVKGLSQGHKATRFGFILKKVYSGRYRYNRVLALPKSSFTKEYKRFRHILVEARKAAGLTQTQLSEKLSRPQSYVSKYERGERRLDMIEFLEVIKALGADPHAIFKSIVDRTSPSGRAGIS